MKKKTMKQSILVVFAMVMMLSIFLSACGSDQAAASASEEETTETAEDQEEITEPLENQSMEVQKTEEAAETGKMEEAAPETEAASEQVVYEGIDMESTLPGLEWLDTFDGIINEPKLVVFNDETNRKVIIENGQKIEFSDNDALVIYIPKGKEASYDSSQNDSAIFREISFEGIRTVNKGLFIGIKDGEEIPLKYVEKIDGYEYELTVTLVARKGE